jgi:FlaG/FlaF family flagellin (archaellin)
MGGDQRGPTTLTATMLVLAVTMIVSATTAFALTGLVDEAPSSGPTVALDVDVSADDVVVTHESGDRLDVAELELVVSGGETERIPFAAFTADQPRDGELTSGESLRLGRGLPPDTDEIRIVYGETVLFKQRLDDW